MPTPFDYYKRTNNSLEGKTCYFFLYKKYKLYGLWSFDSKINLEKKEVIHINEPEYKSCPFPTLNDLIEQGNAEHLSYIEEYTVVPKPDWTVDEVIKEFAEHGFKVSKKAVLHNYNAWKSDLKSGYRGAHSHLNTPCGCNRLRFVASKLSVYGRDWQNTYIS